MKSLIAFIAILVVLGIFASFGSCPAKAEPSKPQIAIWVEGDYWHPIYRWIQANIQQTNFQWAVSTGEATHLLIITPWVGSNDGSDGNNIDIPPIKVNGTTYNIDTRNTEYRYAYSITSIIRKRGPSEDFWKDMETFGGGAIVWQGETLKCVSTSGDNFLKVNNSSFAGSHNTGTRGFMQMLKKFKEKMESISL